MTPQPPLVQRVRDVLRGRRGIEERKMFGGVGFLLRGNLLVGIWKDSLIVRLGRDRASEALREPGVNPCDVAGRPMKGWVLVGRTALEGNDQLRGWVDRAVRFVRTLPPK